MATSEGRPVDFILCHVLGKLLKILHKSVHSLVKKINKRRIHCKTGGILLDARVALMTIVVGLVSGWIILKHTPIFPNLLKLLSSVVLSYVLDSW
jgi:hypothetical protein